MDKKEYWETQDKKIDNLSLNELRAYTKKITRNSQKYFNNWMASEKEIKYGSETLSIVRHGLEDDSKGVRAYAELMYQKIQHDDSGDITFANALSNLLSGEYKNKPPIKALNKN